MDGQSQAAAPPPNLVLAAADGGALLANLALFARLLRRIGFRAGVGDIALAARALCAVGVGVRRDFYWALHSVFVSRFEERLLFRQAFLLFWRRQGGAAADAPLVEEESESAAAARRRAQDAFGGESAGVESSAQAAIHARLVAGADEALRRRDFERMSDGEWEAAKRAVAALRARLPSVPTRRYRKAAMGAIDRRASFRRAVKSGGDLPLLPRRLRAARSPAVVVLCDISGSMAVYSRMFLHLAAGLFGGGRSGAFVFLFGTRLTNISRAMRWAADPDIAVARAASAAPDWGGGTRIGDALAAFNRDWSRRTLSAGAIVLLATDGLERDCDEVGFAAAAGRLRRSCRRLIWLNPLLRYRQYRALARGAAILERSACEVRSIHNIHSLARLAAEIGEW